MFFLERGITNIESVTIAKDSLLHPEALFLRSSLLFASRLTGRPGAEMLAAAAARPVSVRRPTRAPVPCSPPSSRRVVASFPRRAGTQRSRISLFFRIAHII
jgi:hypothetical protein